MYNWFKFNSHHRDYMQLSCRFCFIVCKQHDYDNSSELIDFHQIMSTKLTLVTLRYGTARM